MRQKAEQILDRFLPAPVVGAMAGFILGFLSVFSLRFVRIDASGWPSWGLAAVGAILGCGVGVLFQGPPGRGRTVGRWSAVTAAVVGVVSFLYGFVGPLIVHPDWPQGPLKGIFYTGPLGANAGAALGALIGLVIPQR
jgi:hypothetical protein